MLGIRGSALCGSVAFLRPWLLGVGGSGGSVLQRGVHHLQVFAPEHLQLQHPGQCRFETLSYADPFGARPERVHAAAACRHPRRGARQAAEPERTADLSTAQIPCDG